VLTDRLPFVLPEFMRISWVSDTAREVWEPRLQRIRRAWAELEWLTVLSGFRHGAIIHLPFDDYVTTSRRWVDAGLYSVPLSERSAVLAVAVGSQAAVASIHEAWHGRDRKLCNSRDDRAIGKILNYPPCCISFFDRCWNGLGVTDTTWLMATGGETFSERDIEISGPAEANMILRPLGVRPVFHLPCTSTCSETVETARLIREIGRINGFESEMDWCNEILSWSAEWSALHGIAEIKTPILRIVTQTDATAKKLLIRHVGTTIPDEAGRGLSFPYRTIPPEVARCGGAVPVDLVLRPSSAGGSFTEAGYSP